MAASAESGRRTDVDFEIGVSLAVLNAKAPKLTMPVRLAGEKTLEKAAMAEIERMSPTTIDKSLLRIRTEVA